jgi:hypothetical protein
VLNLKDPSSELAASVLIILLSSGSSGALFCSRQFSLGLNMRILMVVPGIGQPQLFLPSCGIFLFIFFFG